MNNKVSPIILPIVPIHIPTRYSLNSTIIDTSVRKRTTNTPSPPPSPDIHIKPPPPTPSPIINIYSKTNTNTNINTIKNKERRLSINIEKDTDTCDTVTNNTVTNDKDTKDKDNDINVKINKNEIIIKEDMDFEILHDILNNAKKLPSINLRYDRLNVHDYIYNYILFAYNFYNPIFTMYITIISYKQQMTNTNTNTNSSSIFKNVVISYAIIYPLIAMFILLNEAYYVYCKKFIYYKLMDNGVIFKWKKEELHKSIYFWWYILSLIFICIGINDSWNVVLMFINQTSNLCIYVYNTINIETTLITLNGFFEKNIILQTENIKKIIWIDENKVKENVYSIIEARHMIQKNIHNEVKLLISSFIKEDDDDNNKILLENFDLYKNMLNTKTIVEYYKYFENCYADINAIGKINIKREKETIDHDHHLQCNMQFPFYKRKWILTLLNELKHDYNMYWNHKCINCGMLREMNYYLCLVCDKYLCEECEILNTRKSLKTCYISDADMDHKTIQVYQNNDNKKFIRKDQSDQSQSQSWYYKLYYHYNMDNLHIISILDAIYYLSILSIFAIEFYGFYIIFS